MLFAFFHAKETVGLFCMTIFLNYHMLKKCSPESAKGDTETLV